MNPPPFVSVVIITYNTAHYVERAIASALGQTFREIEVIVVDDGSTDQTEELLARRDDIRYLRVRNGGIGSARNHGIRAARGEWIALLDSDDAWHPDKLAWQVQVARDPAFKDVSVIFSDYDEVHEGRLVRPRAMRSGFPVYTECGFALNDLLTLRQRVGDLDVYSHVDFTKLFHGNFILPSSAMLRRAACERFGIFKTHYRSGCEDTDLFLRWGRHTDFACIDRPLLDYTVGRPGQQTATGKLRKMVWTDIKLRKDFLRKNPEFARDHDEFVRRVLAGVYARMGRLDLARGAYRQARIAFAKAGEYEPLEGRDRWLSRALCLPDALLRPALGLAWRARRAVRGLRGK